MFTNPNLLDEIDTKQASIEENPEFYVALQNRIESNFDNYSKIYSWMIEHPDIRRGLLKEDIDSATRGKLISRAREGIKNLREAWKYLRVLKDPFNDGTLKTLATIIEPDFNMTPNFRQDRVSLNMQEYTPPNPLRVPELISQAFFDLKNNECHPVEKAAKAHLYIAGIQPFNNGNKRLARLMQDKILLDANLPPATIPSGEREAYIDILENALSGWNSMRNGSAFSYDLKRKSMNNQRPFFDYIAGKVNSALDHIVGDLNLFRIRKQNQQSVYPIHNLLRQH